MAGVPQVPTNINVPAPDYAALNSPFMQVLKGFQAFQASRQQKTLFDQQVKQTNAQMQSDAARAQVEQSQAQGMQQTQALQLYNLFGQQGLKQPGAPATPAYRQRMEQLAAAAGMPSPYDEQGNFNGDAFKQQMTPQLMAQLRSLQPGAMRDALGNTISGYTDDMRTEAVDYTGKERAELQHAADMGVHYKNGDAVLQGRLKVEQLNEQLRAELNPLKKQQIQAQIDNLKARSSQSYASAARQQQQATMLSQEIQAGLPQLRAQAEAYKMNGSAQSAKAVVSTYTRILGVAQRAKIAMEAADAAFEQSQQDGGDPATVQQFAAKKAAATQAYQTATTLLQNTYSDLQSQIGASSHLRAGMGVKSVGIGGKLNLPPPPSSVLDNGPNNPMASGSVFSTDPHQAAGEQDTPYYLNTRQLPKGAKVGTGQNGQTYYLYNGAMYDATGTLVPSL